MASLYKTTNSKKEILALYDEKLNSLNIDYHEKIVKTTFGNTHIIITGNEKNPPIMIIHGSNGCAPIALETYINLSTKYQVYAVDILAQPNKSAETRLNMKNDSYGKWMNEIIEKIQLKNIILAGFSLGGLVILKTLEFNEKNIKEVFLTTPAYIVNGNPLQTLFKIFIPMKRYIGTSNKKYLEKFLSVIFTDNDEFAHTYLSNVFLNFKMDYTPIPVIKQQKAQNIKTPITIIGAKQDILFPGSKMMKRSKKIFPTLKKMVLLDNSKHVPSKKDNLIIENIILNS